MTKIDKGLIDPKVEPASEKAHRVARAAMGAIPVLGSPILEAFQALVEPPMLRRRTAWMIEVTDAINRLYERGLVTMADLQQNEQFFTTLVHASGIALRSHEKEKLKALRAAVVNAGLPGAPETVLQNLFLNAIDRFSDWHILLLRLFQDPEGWAKAACHPFPSWSQGSLNDVIVHAFPELRSHKLTYKMIWQELYQHAFVSSDSMGGSMSRAGMLAKRTTPIGDQFLTFVTEPDLPNP